jgi:hypothetical protein
MPAYPGPINSDVPLQFPFTQVAPAPAPPVLTPAPQGLSRGGFTWLFGIVSVPQVPPAFENLSALAPIASQRASVQIGNALPLESISIEVEFNGAPGAFEIDIQDADTDADAFYQTIPNAKIMAVSAQNIARFELNPFTGKFVRVVLKSLTNNVGLRVKVTGQ